MAKIKLPPFRKVIWLMPAAYALHIVEEYVGNFPGWVTHDVHRHFSYLLFDLNNLAFMIILLTLVTINYRNPTPLKTTSLVVAASANLFWDALFHLFTTPLFNHYSPGLVTAMLLYYPITILVALVILREGRLSPRRFFLSVLGGLFLFAFVVWYGLFQFAV